ncbi:hypothetical protein [Legionella brunensis]|uniref:Lipoprotein n=1 Tax=Legionella brunensis TaxID=29422 RepID=A0A0W0S1K1_9GAMM|nr:hypothetical protein [Legionella brunensis]KTC76989.1 hypothetical protein Lbru_3096 [Legionella brunensis]
MKKNPFSVVTYTVILSAPLLLSACQGIEGLFTDSPNRTYDARPSYGNSQHTTTVYQSGSPTQTRSSSAQRGTTYSTENNNSSNTNSSAASASASALGAPQTSTQASKKTVGTAVPTEAPTVGQ